MTHTLSTADKALRARIELDSETIEWKELVLFFARGKVVFVSREVDLVDVAFQMSKDNQTLVQELMRRGLIERLTDERARRWFDDNIVVRATVVTPWVLVQEALRSSRDLSLNNANE